MIIEKQISVYFCVCVWVFVRVTTTMKNKQKTFKNKRNNGSSQWCLMFKKRLHFRFSLYYRFFTVFFFFWFCLFLFGRNTRKIMPRLYKHIIVKRDWFSLHPTSLFLVQKVWTCNNVLCVVLFPCVCVCTLYNTLL